LGGDERHRSGVYGTFLSSKAKISGGALLLILMAEGHFDHSIYSSNKILNLGETKWKLRTFDDYAQEVKGRPWVGRQPFDVWDNLKKKEWSDAVNVRDIKSSRIPEYR
jgi:hypothetical protein